MKPRGGVAGSTDATRLQLVRPKRRRRPVPLIRRPWVPNRRIERQSAVRGAFTGDDDFVSRSRPSCQKYMSASFIKG